jgi:hypothetical protein
MASPPTVYVETSVVSYLVAGLSSDPVVRGHQVTTLEWWERQLPLVRGLISPAVMAEAARGNPVEAAKRVSMLARLEALSGGPEVEALAAIYPSRRLIPESSAYDALHLAYACFHAVDFLLTWNCRHLASAVTRKRFSAINAELGRATPVLCTPEELMEL